MTNERYEPEMLQMILCHTQNMVLFIVCGLTMVFLYKYSGQFHALWALLMLGMTSRTQFVRD